MSDLAAEIRRLSAEADKGTWKRRGSTVITNDPVAEQRQRDRDARMAANLKTPNDYDSVAGYGGALIAESMYEANAALMALLRNNAELLADALDGGTRS